MKMADYKESAISAVRHVRTNRINIENGLGAYPIITFAEEEVYTLEKNGIVARPVGSLSAVLDDPKAMIELRDPNTWELTGESIPMMLVYQALGSTYINMALERDKKQAEMKPSDEV
jgi:hypothetical protein